LHKGHAFRNDNQRDELGAQEMAKVIHRLSVDSVDPHGKTMYARLGYKFAFEGMHTFDQVMEFLQKCRVLDLLWAHAGNRLAGKPAALVIGIENFEVAAFDFDDQPQLLRKLELVTVVLRSAEDEIANVDRTRLHPRFDVVCTAHTNSGIDA